MVLASVSLLVAAATVACVILCYYFGNVAAFKIHFVDLRIFANSQANTLPAGAVGVAAVAPQATA